MALTKVYDAATVFRHLNGILNVYKPAGMKVKHVRNAILSNIAKGKPKKYFTKYCQIKVCL